MHTSDQSWIYQVRVSLLMTFRKNLVCNKVMLTPLSSAPTYQGPYARGLSTHHTGSSICHFPLSFCRHYCNFTHICKILWVFFQPLCYVDDARWQVTQKAACCLLSLTGGSRQPGDQADLAQRSAPSALVEQAGVVLPQVLGNILWCNASKHRCKSS